MVAREIAIWEKLAWDMALVWKVEVQRRQMWHYLNTWQNSPWLLSMVVKSTQRSREAAAAYTATSTGTALDCCLRTRAYPCSENLADEWNGYTRIQRTSKKRQKPKVLFLQYGAWIPRDAIGNRKQQGSIPEELSRQTHKTCRDTLDQSVSGSADRREVISHRTVGGLA